MAYQKMASSIKYEKQALLAGLEDVALMKNVDDTHKPDGRTFDVKPVMGVIEQIFRQITPTMLAATSQAAVATEDKADHASIRFDALGGLSYTIHKIACEITCKCSGGTDSHATTMELLSGTLSVYSWERKVVLALAAAAMSYGEFSLTGRLCAINPLAKSVAVLKRLPDVVEQVDALKPKFDALNNLIKAMLETTRCLIEFSDLPLDYISLDAPAMVTTQCHIPTAVYWIVNSAVTSAVQVVGQTSMRHEYHVSEACELSSSRLAQKVNSIHGLLSKQLEICMQIIDEKKSVESFRTVEHLFQTNHDDNMEIMKAIFPSKDGRPFIQSSPDKVNVETLRWKIVLLLFSDLQIREEGQLTFLSHFYEAFHEGLETTFEIVWVPIVDSNDDVINLQEKHENTILEVAAEMPWLTAHPPPHPNSTFLKYVRKEWKFENKPILVALDGQGKATNPNALHMINIWEDGAYPFSTAREEALWKTVTWKLDFIVHGVDIPELRSPIGEKKQICLYGGEDIEWIRSFTSKMNEIKKVAGISMEMAYLGVPHPRASTTKKIVDTVLREKISASYPSESIRFFWTRLERMLHSLMQSRKGLETDGLQREVITLLTYGDSGRGWAVFAGAGDEMLVADGKAFLHGFSNVGYWKDEIIEKGFHGALQTGLDLLKSPDHCLKLVLPSSTIVHHVACPECRKNMKAYLLLKCCDEELVPNTAAGAAAATAGPGADVDSGPVGLKRKQDQKAYSMAGEKEARLLGR
ncbi:hypothetical protein EJ110_NYTH41048 [Nymphaea thermarum]|nr:hypothetical protein EJ110_NYTH41048 [Nymphaea thermarum]